MEKIKMVKKLAIKGHPTRGNEVIELLEMLGGVNGKINKKTGKTYNIYNGRYFIPEIGNIREVAYYIDFESQIRCIDIKDITTYFIVYSLEMFLKTFPFKAGDKVYIKVDPNANCLGSEKIYGVVESALWVEESGHVVYKLKDCSGIFYSEELHPCEEEVSMEDNKLSSKYYEETQSKRDMEKTMFMLGHTLVPNKVYNNLEYEITDGYKFDRVENGKIILKPINPKYPKTYEECCKVLGISYRTQLSYTNPDVERGNTYLTKEKQLLDSFMRLRICRNAYWKIAGEEMGLDKPWEPDFTDTKEMYYIFYKGYIEKGNQRHPNNHILIFPTPEMRDAFYENFKTEIEQCKELL